MPTEKLSLKNGDTCEVVKGTHAGKSGIVQDMNTSKTGHITITVLQKSGVRFKTLGRNVAVKKSSTGAKKAVAPVRSTQTGSVGAKKSTGKPETIPAYHATLATSDQAICKALKKEIDAVLTKAESKIWHAHPVWFLDGNPIVGYHKLKDCVRLLFWSGQSFDEAGLKPEGTFKAAEARYTNAKEINVKDLKRWLGKSQKIQWDYKNLIKRKGKLERLK